MRSVLLLVLLAGLGAGSYYFFAGHRSEPLQAVLRPQEGLRWSLRTTVKAASRRFVPPRVQPN